ncbi:MAG: protein translocase subunit SecDF, partial [Planctomycetes bacterium]|nr:protein translocase subunit SecDF [Planctomycetota bacterium]
FDRIRENLRKMAGSLAEIIDVSIAQTMPRTVLTSLTVIVTVVVLLIFGGDALKPFTATLLIGLISGTYSSVFVASPLLLSFKGRIAPPTPEAGVAEGAGPADDADGPPQPAV